MHASRCLRWMAILFIYNALCGREAQVIHAVQVSEHQLPRGHPICFIYRRNWQHTSACIQHRCAVACHHQRCRQPACSGEEACPCTLKHDMPFVFHSNLVCFGTALQFLPLLEPSRSFCWQLSQCNVDANSHGMPSNLSVCSAGTGPPHGNPGSFSYAHPMGHQELCQPQCQVGTLIRPVHRQQWGERQSISGCVTRLEWRHGLPVTVERCTALRLQPDSHA